ncbi:MAG: TldD/PmbA family protein [Planctomycetes bacterium]|nr:TldD/PmbA family protein [Planctomycetota bacterium]
MTPPLSPAPPRDPLYYDFFGIDEELLRRVFAELMGHGADYGDLYFEQSRRSSISMEDGIISRASSSVDRGVGVRAVVGDQTGYAYSEDLDLQSMLQAARTAASIARGGGGAPPQGFARREFADLYAIPHAWEDVEVATILPLVAHIDATCRRLDPAITKVSVTWANADSRVLVVTSEGFAQADRRPMGLVAASVTAEKDGQVQSGSANLSARHGVEHFDTARLDEMCRKAVDRTMILFEARKPPAGELPVVLAAGASGILLHEAIGHGMEADFNRKGTSIFSTMIDKKVAADCVTIVDSALHPHERGALNFDDEGNATERTVLVEQGTMRSYLHDRLSAKHYGIPSTGSGRRQSFRHAPMPRMRCTYMENGPHSREEIIASVDRGIIAETFTNGQVAIGAGDFTFYIKNGWLIEHGKITAPIKDVNIIGNGPEALGRITMVADDLAIDSGGWTCGKDGQSVPVSQGLPTALVSKLTVGGEDA